MKIRPDNNPDSMVKFVKGFIIWMLIFLLLMMMAQAVIKLIKFEHETNYIRSSSEQEQFLQDNNSERSWEFDQVR